MTGSRSAISCNWRTNGIFFAHYGDVIMGEMASQITSLTIVYSTVYSGVDQRKHQNPASLAFVRGIHRWPVNSPHKGPVTRKMFPFDDVNMKHVMHMHEPLQWRHMSVMASQITGHSTVCFAACSRESITAPYYCEENPSVTGGVFPCYEVSMCWVEI